MKASEFEKHIQAAWAWWPFAGGLRGGLCRSFGAHLGGCLYACGGRDGGVYHGSCERYELSSPVAEPGSGQWQALAPLAQARCYAACARYRGRVWLLGGATRAGAVLQSCECLEGDVWRLSGQLQSARASAVAAELRIGLVVCGGAGQEAR